jgi:hypothetical protein
VDDTPAEADAHFNLLRSLIMQKTTLILIVMFIAACATTPPKEDAQELPAEAARTQPLMGMDGVACVGELMATPQGFEELDEGDGAALLAQSIAPSGKGGLCAGEVFLTKESIKVYRVWNSSKEYTRLGRWWSLERPEGTRDEYRRAYAICRSWSALDRLVSCTIKPNTSVVIGVTQSATCEEPGEYDKTGAQQVYVPNDAAAGAVFVEDCVDEGEWPATP